MNFKKKNINIFLIDGNHYLYRAFYAIKNLSNLHGLPTNAIYGFTRMIFNILNKYQPEYIIVIFDSQSYLRSKLYVNYKSNRKKIPESLVIQIPLIKKILSALSIPVIQMEGIEADDIIGKLAIDYASKNYNIVILSNDKDMMQVISDNIVMFDTMHNNIIDIEKVKKIFGVNPKQIVDVLSIIGDKSDNIPGIPGIGLKNASKLVLEFNSIENLIINVPKIKNARFKDLIIKHANLIMLNKNLISFEKNIKINFNILHTKLKCYNYADKITLYNLFQECNFINLINNLDSKFKLNKKSKIIINNIKNISELDNLILQIKKIGKFSFDICYINKKSSLLFNKIVIGIAVCLKSNESFYIDCNLFKNIDHTILKQFLNLFEDKFIEKICYDINTINNLLIQLNISLNKNFYDIKIIVNLLNPYINYITLDNIIVKYLTKNFFSVKPIKNYSSNLMNSFCYKTCAIFNLLPILFDHFKKDSSKFNNEIIN